MKSPFKFPLEGNEREHSTEICSVNAKILCHKMTCEGNCNWECVVNWNLNLLI